MPEMWNDRGEKVRRTIPAKIWEGCESIGAGIDLIGLYYDPSSKRKVARTYSHWQKRDGSECVGEELHLLNDYGEAIRYCDVAGINPSEIGLDLVDDHN